MMTCSWIPWGFCIVNRHNEEEKNKNVEILIGGVEHSITSETLFMEEWNHKI